MGKGLENLISLADRPEEERKAIASKGGRAKAEKAKQRKIVAETFNEILSLEYDDFTPFEIDTIHTGYKYGFEDFGMEIDLQGHTLLTRLCAKIVYRAIVKGDMRASEIILRYIEPTE